MLRGSFLRIFIAGVLMFSSFSLSAQMGAWKTFLAYNNVSQVVQSHEKIYALSNGALFSVDFEYNSIETYTRVNGLNDGNIRSIAYSEQEDVVVVVYENSNIDLISGSRVVNISDLKRKEISNKSVNSIYTHGRYAYLACGFGIVSVDLKREEIADTYIVGENGGYESVSAVRVAGDSIYALTKACVLGAPVKSRNLADFSQWKRFYYGNSDAPFNALASFADRLFVVRDNVLYHHDKGSLVKVWAVDSLVDVSEKGVLTVFSNDSVFSFDHSLNVVKMFALPNIVCGLFSPVKSTYWCSLTDAGGNSILYEIQDGEVVDRYLPRGPMASSVPFVKYQQGKLITGSGGPFDLSLDTPGLIQVMENGQWISISEGTFPEGVLQPGIPFVDVLDAAIDPTDPRRMYVASWRSLFVLYDNVPVKQYWEDPFPYEATVRILVDGLTFDKDNNLWMAVMLDKNLVKVLTPTGEFHSLYYPELDMKESVKELMHSKNGYLWIVCPRAKSGQGIFVADLNGTPLNSRDDRHILINNLLDKDGNSVTPTAFRCVAEDKNGVIWIGTSSGPYLVTEPSKIFNPDFRFDRVKITRADNANFADYLLANEQINAILVDGGNRKWVGTAASGVYLLSEDGTETIHHFTTENSPLTSNAIMDLTMDEKTGEVFIATASGLFSYSSDATEGAPSYNEVKVYPNPVTPDFEGDVTIAGLIENSLVRIADTEGRVICQGYSNGGAFTWNGKDLNGRRVDSGVYFIFAAQEDGSSKMVSKVAFIK